MCKCTMVCFWLINPYTYEYLIALTCRCSLALRAVPTCAAAGVPAETTYAALACPPVPAMLKT